MVHHSAFLLLLLTCLADFTVSETEQGGTKEVTTYRPLSVVINGVDMVTVGISSGFQCSATCYPSYQYTWTRGNVTSQGSELNLLIQQQVPTQILTCTAVNPATKKSVTVQKTLRVTADCHPSCSYSWTVMLEDETFDTAQGNTIFVTPPVSTVVSENLICEAENTVSHLFISTTLSLWEEDEQKFASRLQMAASDYSKIEPLTCEATNTLNQASITATQNLTVIDPISVRPTSLPVAGEPLSLQCLGSQNPTSITWLKNKHPMPAYERVRFSADNITMTFSPLLQADDGLYQCVVAEGAAAILSVGYKMQVNSELQCLADCFPVCSITWYYHDTLLATNASIFFTPVTPPYQAALTCVAFNSVTKKNRMAETTVVVPDGRKNVTISGPDSLEVGVTASFTCSAECTPPCSFTWTLYGKKMMGRVIDITVNRHISTESISCQAENAFTGKTAMVNEMLSVSEPHWCGC
eukprot:superscaffoldBa00001797_g12055